MQGSGGLETSAAALDCFFCCDLCARKLRRESAGSRGVELSIILQDLMHTWLAVSSGDGIEWVATSLDGENHGRTACATARGMGVVMHASHCELKRGGVSPLPRLPGASDRASATCIDSKLGPVPKQQAIANDCDPAHIGYGDQETQACKMHVSGDTRPSLLIDPGDSSLDALPQPRELQLVAQLVPCPKRRPCAPHAPLPRHAPGEACPLPLQISLLARRSLAELSGATNEHVRICLMMTRMHACLVAPS